ALQPHSAAGTLFAPPVRSPACLTCPQFCEWAGSPFVGSVLSVPSPLSVYHCRSSCPEYAHGELPCTVLSLPLPVISPANAALVPRAITAITKTALTTSRSICPALLVSSAPERVPHRRYVISSRKAKSSVLASR